MPLTNARKSEVLLISRETTPRVGSRVRTIAYIYKVSGRAAGGGRHARCVALEWMPARSRSLRTPEHPPQTQNLREAVGRGDEPHGPHLLAHRPEYQIFVHPRPSISFTMTCATHGFTVRLVLWLMSSASRHGKSSCSPRGAAIR